MRVSRRLAGAALSVSDDAADDADGLEWERELFWEEDVSE